MGKFIIEKEDKEAVYLMYADEDGDVMVEGAYLTPYIEPDREKAAADAFQRGYEHAKHECADCRKIRADTEQELADNAYQRGLDDAWEAARKIVDCAIPYEALENYLEIGECTADVIKHLPASKAIEIVRQYEQEQKEIKVGDEVKLKCGVGSAIYMQGSNGSDEIYLLFNDGSCGFHKRSEIECKTGRHFPEIAEVLRKMREDAPT